MKKIVLLTMCLLAFCNAKAQYIGLKAGYNYANLKGEMSSDASIRPYHGYYAGITLEFPLSKLFSLQIEGIYNRRGANIQSNTYGKAKLSLDYLSAPVLARFNVGRGINLHVGPQLEYRIDKPNFYFDGTDPVTRVKPDALDMVDLGMTAGIGYTTDSGWVFELRYLQGLTSIFESDSSLYNTHFSTDYDFKNRTISVGVGYIF
ncbi:porin family protein [Capnocytophaga sp. oral taxon 878]|uniref:porin family protein n=1 Tax=Capnocytophaga sp. oral taxon 878 TaxID=1316596 RepID=UPI000D038E6C|nr:porin family protein [Capnocytophaga sp. oral taxon 878]AVM49824.1 PorT family protein [Capnocytophaga sp. oral taxon 878]